jgi:hypothetical protein
MRGYSIDKEEEKEKTNKSAEKLKFRNRGRKRWGLTGNRYEKA